MTAAARHTDEVVVYPARRFLTMNRIQSRRRASQYCGGIGEDERKACLFTDVVDGGGRRYGIDVAVGALSANPEIYGIGMRQSLDRIGEAWLHSIGHPVPPIEVAAAPYQEVILTGEDVTQPGNGSAALPVPISTPSFDAAHYFTGDWVGCGARKWARRRTLPETNLPSPEIDAEN